MDYTLQRLSERIYPIIRSYIYVSSGNRETSDFYPFNLDSVCTSAYLSSFVRREVRYTRKPLSITALKIAARLKFPPFALIARVRLYVRAGSSATS